MYVFGKNNLVSPSEEQRKIIEGGLDENMKILACAGSGKTTTLVMRLDYLVKNGVEA